MTFESHYNRDTYITGLHTSEGNRKNEEEQGSKKQRCRKPPQLAKVVDSCAACMHAVRNAQLVGKSWEVPKDF